MEDNITKSQEILGRALDDIKANGLFQKSFTLYGSACGILSAYAVLKPALSKDNDLDDRMRGVFGDDLINKIQESNDFPAGVIMTGASVWTNDYVIQRQALECLPEYRDLLCVAMNANITAYDLADEHSDDTSKSDYIFERYVSGMRSVDPGLEPMKQHVRQIMKLEFGDDFVKELDRVVDDPSLDMHDVFAKLMRDFQETHRAVPENSPSDSLEDSPESGSDGMDPKDIADRVDVSEDKSPDDNIAGDGQPGDIDPDVPADGVSRSDRCADMGLVVKNDDSQEYDGMGL